MDYKDAAAELLKLIGEVGNDEALAAAALETAGAVHTEALIASLSAYTQAARIVKASQDAQGAPKKETSSGALLQPMPEETAEVQIAFPLPLNNGPPCKQAKRRQTISIAGTWMSRAIICVITATPPDSASSIARWNPTERVTW